VAEPVHDDLEVGASGEQPGGVGAAQVVEADLLADAGSLDGGPPDAGVARRAARSPGRR
jgi:hypothetical protein